MPGDCHMLLMIHGTGAAAQEDEGPKWWQLRSEFCEWVHERMGPSARCASKVFHWSGENSEQARQAAGTALLEKWLLRFERRQEPYHLIAHSHGGSVIWAALREAERRKIDLAYLRSWSTVGTPFLRFVPDPVNRWLFRPLLGSLLALVTVATGGGTIYWTWDPNDPILIREPLSWVLIPLTLFLVVSLPMLIALLVYCLLRWVSGRFAASQHRAVEAIDRSAFQKYGPRWFGYRSRHDEAIHGLRQSRFLQGPIAGRVKSWGFMARTLMAAYTPLRELRGLRADYGAGVTAEGAVMASLPAAGAGDRSPRVDRWLAIPTVLIAALAWKVGKAVPVAIEKGNPGLVIIVGIALAVTFYLFLALSYSAVRALLSRTATAPPQPGVDSEEDEDHRIPTWSFRRSLLETLPGRMKWLFGRMVILPLQLLHREVYGPFHNWLVAPMIDEFIWDRLIRKAHGNDLGPVVVVDVMDAPVRGALCPELPEEVDRTLVEQADQHAGEAIGRLRTSLGVLTVSGSDLSQVTGGLQKMLTWRELVHNSYFADPAFREAVAACIGAVIERGEVAEPLAALPDGDGNDLGLQEARRRGRDRGWYGVASLVLGYYLVLLAPFVILGTFIAFFSLLAALAAAIMALVVWI
jgi:hypothetical protein